MAEYYALLNRAVGALPRNDEASRREIYVKARSALVKQLKAIDPPLPAAEISKQRLALEDAIRRVEREAIEAVASSALSEEEISRRAEDALQQALGGSAAVGMSERAPVEERPQRAAVYAEEPPEPAPVYESADERSDYDATPEDDNTSYAEVVTPSVQPRTMPRSQPAPFERAPNVTDVDTGGAPPRQQPRMERSAPSRGRSGGRGWEQPPRRRERRSIAGRLTLLVLIVLVLGAMAYYLITNWDEVEDLTDSLLGNEPEAADDAGDAGAEGGVEGVIEGAEGGDPAAAEAPVVEEPVVFTEPSAVFYVEPDAADGPAARYEATINWELLSNSTGPVIAADITVPERGLSIMLRIGQSPDPNFSHEVIVQANVASGADGGALASVANLAVKSSEEGIGVALTGDPEVAADFFFIELPIDAERQNTTRLSISPWFDLSFVYESGDQAILSFSKGTEGAQVFEEAFAAWDAE